LRINDAYEDEFGLYVRIDGPVSDKFGRYAQIDGPVPNEFSPYARTSSARMRTVPDVREPIQTCL
jgi:hypothetical protein